MLWILSIAISVHCSFVILSMTLSSCLPISKERLRTFSCSMAQSEVLSQQLHCSYIVLPTFVLMCLISVKITFYLSATSTSMQGQLCSNYFSGADLALGCCFCARLLLLYSVSSEGQVGLPACERKDDLIFACLAGVEC